MTRSRFLYLAAILLLICLDWQVLRGRTEDRKSTRSEQISYSGTAKPGPTAPDAAHPDPEPTLVYAHNLLLRKGPQFRIYVRWIRGEMLRTRKDVNPSFDDPDSFVLDVQKGVIRVNIGDITNFLNGGGSGNVPLTGISIEPMGERVKLHGVVHKIVPLPVSLIGTLGPVADGRVRFHVEKVDVLKLPLGGFLRDIHIELADLVHAGGVAGIEIAGNDIFFDTQKLLPPPHLRGRITAVRVRVPDLEVIYGGAGDDDSRLAQWHNFLRLRGGMLDFGKLAMQHVDLTLIDASKDAWFDLDLVNYQAQLINGYMRMTPEAGLNIFMPDLDEKAPKVNRQITMEWLKDRTRSVPELPGQ